MYEAVSIMAVPDSLFSKFFAMLDGHRSRIRANGVVTNFDFDPVCVFFDDFPFFGPNPGTGRNQNREYRHHFATEHDTPSPRRRQRTQRGPEPNLSVWSP
jgi:hypothetical protein